jgi:FMN phosphatase YigB (HAD superfamily)
MTPCRAKSTPEPLDPELAEAMFRVEWEPAARPVYPDVAHVLAAVRDRGTKIAVVSDIHFDIRPDCVAQGIDRFVGVYVSSYEVAAQKPDPRITRNGGLIEGRRWLGASATAGLLSLVFGVGKHE